MCRSIKTLRPPYTDSEQGAVGDDDVRAAALQYVRKVAGMRAPAAANAEVFDAAVEAVATATQELLDRLVVRPVRRPPGAEPAVAPPVGAAVAPAGRQPRLPHRPGAVARGRGAAGRVHRAYPTRGAAVQPDPRPGEEDVDRDDHEVLSRATGGVPDETQPDQGSSTGTTPNDTMVGRVSGQDVGYAGETGAERRAEWEKEQGQRD